MSVRTFIEFLHEQGEVGNQILTEKNWIAGAIKHPGRCTPFPNPDCPKDSPQGKLAQRFKSGDLHTKKKKD